MDNQAIQQLKDEIGEHIYHRLSLHIRHQAINEFEQNQRYNGWTNYVTWLVNLHLTNESEELVELSRDIDTSEHTKFDYVYKLARYYKEHYNDLIHDMIEHLPYIIKDLTNASLQDVDWRSIAQHIADDYYEPEDFISEKDD